MQSAPDTKVQKSVHQPACPSGTPHIERPHFAWHTRPARETTARICGEAGLLAPTLRKTRLEEDA